LLGFFLALGWGLFRDLGRIPVSLRWEGQRERKD
jgi:hypothetical protein